MKNKFLKLMALFVASAFVGNAGAQTDGNSYYLYNEASDMFLSRGSTWGTRAVAANYGISFTFTKQSGEGVYTLKNDDHSLVVNTEKYLGTDIYTDQAAQNYTFTATGTGYTIAKNGTDYLVINAANTYGQQEIGTTAESSDATIWQLLTKSEYEQKLQELQDARAKEMAQAINLSSTTFSELIAEITNTDMWATKDYTSNVGNANIGGGSGSWKKDATEAKRGVGDTKAGSGVFQSWNGCVNINQTITGLPEGIYKVSAQAFYRHGDADSGVR
ncbi:MAG: hypothetical protein IIW35_06560, partial [Bacteroidaceae bacterium]|nr:hypothetical protein [Bacteroidaceae bacterium]